MTPQSTDRPLVSSESRETGSVVPTDPRNAVGPCRASEAEPECCHNCAHLLADHSHPMTDGEPITHLRGWICNNPELGAYSGWTQHGLCEGWESRPCRHSVRVPFIMARERTWRCYHCGEETPEPPPPPPPNKGRTLGRKAKK